MLQGADGWLYGTTAYSGSGSRPGGTVFKLRTDGSDFTVLKNFDDSTTGGLLYSGLIQGRDGSLYGTASHGGSGGGGTVFRLSQDGTEFSILKSFGFIFYREPNAGGAYPFGKLLQGVDGALYGTTVVGGSHSGGTVFKVNPDGTAFTVLKDFDYQNSLL